MSLAEIGLLEERLTRAYNEVTERGVVRGGWRTWGTVDA